MRSLLKDLQNAWARSCGLAVDDAGYTHRPEENLPWLTPRTRADFEAADGNEFGATRKRAKIAALHSSSALAVNVFDYWTVRNAAPLAAALNLAYPIADIRFERKFPTGVGSRAPNLDVVIAGPDRQLLAVESKFLRTLFVQGKADPGQVLSARRRTVAGCRSVGSSSGS